MPADTPESIRLNKHLALQLGVSRREADTFIENGRVTINDTVASLGARVKKGDTVAVDNKTIASSKHYEYLLLNKPAGYVCSRKAQGSSPTVYELLPPELHHLKLVGRLDRDSSGLILLTNDGNFAYRMTHPSFKKTKVYHVQLDHSLEPLHQQMISDYGIQLEDGISKFLVTRLDPLSTHPTSYSKQDTAKDALPMYEITMHEGRNRQIRRTFAALGYSVVSLHRVVFAEFSLGTLQPGHYQSFTTAP